MTAEQRKRSRRQIWKDNRVKHRAVARTALVIGVVAVASLGSLLLGSKSPQTQTQTQTPWPAEQNNLADPYGTTSFEEEEDKGTGPNSFCYIENILPGTNLTWDNITECGLPDDGGLPHQNRCGFVKCVSECQDDDGFIDYLKLPYCALDGSIAGTIIILAGWILILFIALGTTAEDFFCPALSVISDTLNLSDNVAGVTFLAFGNGAPDIFSVVTSIVNSTGNKGASLAIGELFGAGMFVTTVVVGAVGWTVPFTVTRRPFLRDVLCYIAAATWTAVVLFDGEIHLYEGLSFVGIYVLYVFVVVVGRKIYQSRKKKNGVAVDPVEAKKDRAMVEELGEIKPIKTSIENRPSVYEDADEGVNYFTEASNADDTRITGVEYGQLAIKVENEDDGEEPSGAKIRKFGSATNVINPQLITLRVETEERLRSGSISTRPNHHPTTASLAVSRAAHAAHKNIEIDDAVDHELGHLNRASIYEDDDVKEAYNAIEEAENQLLDRKDFVEQKEPFRQMLDEINPMAESFWEDKWYWKIYAFLRAPVFISLVLTIPVVDFEEEGQRWCKPLNVLHIFLCPVFVCFGGGLSGNTIGEQEYPLWALIMCVGIVGAAIVAAITDPYTPPKYHAAYGYLGFAVSVAWIYVIANEIVNVLQTIGFLVGLSDAILGLTVLAWGNSIGDFVSNLTVAKQGFPRMAVGACYGGPALNILLGIGIACSFKTATTGESYKIPKALGLEVSGGFLLASLLSALTIVPLSGFYIGKKFGAWLLTLYLASMVTGIYIEVTDHSK